MESGTAREARKPVLIGAVAFLLLFVLGACMATPRQQPLAPVPTLGMVSLGSSQGPAPVWWSTRVLSTGRNYVTCGPSLAVDGERNLHVVWDRYNVDERIFYQVWNATTAAWGSIEVVSTESNDAVRGPSQVVDGAGNVHVAWFDYSDYGGASTYWDIFYKMKNASTGAWGLTEVVSIGSWGSSEYPSLAVDVAGNVHVAWMDNTDTAGAGSDFDIFYKVRNATLHTWSTVEVVSIESMKGSYLPTLAVDMARNVHVAWQEEIGFGGTNASIVYKLRNFTTGAWSMLQVISNESWGTSFHPSMVVDLEGNEHITWTDNTNINGSGTDYDIFYKVRNATTGTWSSTQVVSTESTGTSDNPSVVVDGAGNVHVAWEDVTNYGGSGSDQDIFYKAWNATTGTWGTTQVVSAESAIPSDFPSLAVDAAGTVHVTWFDHTINYGSGWDFYICYKKKALNMPPLLTSPVDLTFTYGSIGNNISWIITDASISTPTYSILDNDSSIASDAWSSGVPFTFNVDGLVVGTHNFMIIATDGYNASTQDTVVIAVLNAIPLITRPPDITYVGPWGQTVTWIITDASTTTAHNYTICRNGVAVVSGTWSAGVAISHSLDGIDANGVYNLTIIASDGFGGLVQDTVMVTINITPLIVGIFAGFFAIVGIIVLVPKRSAIAGRLRSMRATVTARRQAPGRIDEVLYLNPKIIRKAKKHATQHANPTSMANSTAGSCSACGRPVPKGAEKARLCLYCGKAMP